MFTRFSSRLSLLFTLATMAGACTAPVSNLPGELPSATTLPTLPAIAPTATLSLSPKAGPQTATASATAPTPTATRLPPSPTATLTPQASPIGVAIPAVLASNMAEVERQICALRGLTLIRPLVQRLVNSDQLRKQTIRDLAKDYSHAQARHEATLYWLLRFGARDADLYSAHIDFYSSDIAGFYDYDADRVFLIANEAPFGPWERTVYAHEIVHALQDQHYDLATIMRPDLEADETLARRALVEGDAMLAEGAYYWQHLSDADREAISGLAETFDTSTRARTPPYLIEAFDFPYTAGVDFTMALWRRGKWEAINAALNDPPASSEQILHPEKYLDLPRDQPLAVTIPDLAPALGPSWSEVLSDTFGEFDLRFFLRAIGAQTPEQAAAGWGGARYSLWQHGSAAVSVVETRWDSELDAGEFGAALHQTLIGADSAGDLYVDDGRYIALVERGSQVTLISGSERAAVERVLDKVR